LVPLLFVTLFVSYLADAEEDKKYTSREAVYHVGETATVCGVVASTKWATRSKGQPTFLNLDEPYPNQIFTILIWGSDRPAFGSPENMYASKRICATGRIKEYRGKAEIIAKNPKQIKVE
jgi:micrococcal nuclease